MMASDPKHSTSAMQDKQDSEANMANTGITGTKAKHWRADPADCSSRGAPVLGFGMDMLVGYADGRKHLRLVTALHATWQATVAATQRVAAATRRYFHGRQTTTANPFGAYKVLRTVSAAVLVAFTSSVVSPAIAAAQVKKTGALPPQIAQWMPKKQSSLIATFTQSNAVAATSLVRMEEALKRSVPELFSSTQVSKFSAKSELNTSTDRQAATRRAVDEVLEHMGALNEETQKAHQQFASDREQLRSIFNGSNDSESTAQLLKRHTIAVAEFESRAAELNRLMQAVKDAHAMQQTTSSVQTVDATKALQALAAFVTKNPNQRVHQAADPGNLPFRFAKAEVRAPIEDARTFADYLAVHTLDKAKQVKRDGVAGIAANLQTKQIDTAFSLLNDNQRRVEQGNPGTPQNAQPKAISKTPGDAKAASSANTSSASSATAIAAPAFADLAETEDVQLTPAIRAKAAALHYNPVEIYNFVRNSIAYLPTYGSIQGSDMTLATGRGNAFDTASLTIALLRASGIYARYAYGTVEIPAAQAQNWVGGATTPEAAQSLISQGGIPNVVVVSGGKIASFRVEHVWVEAYVKYFPSRGAKHTGDPANSPTSPKGTVGDTWIPMDASFKQFAYAAPIDIVGQAGVDVNAIRTAANTGAGVDPVAGWVEGVNNAAFADAFEDAQHQALSFLTTRNPAATFEDVLGKRTIIPETPSFLPGTLRTQVRTVSLRTAELPAAMRWTINVDFYGTETDRQLDSPSAQSILGLPKLNVKRLGVQPMPATQADADVLAALSAQGASQLSPYAISVKPQLQLDGLRIAEAPAQRMGNTVYWSLTINGPGQSPRRADYKLNSGDEIVFGINAIGIDPNQHQFRSALHNTVSASNNLQQVALAYWAQHDVYDEMLAATSGQTTQRLPSAGVFAARLNVRYFLGVPTSGYYLGRSMDVKQNVRAIAGGTLDQAIKIAIQSGVHGSYLEGFTFDALFNHDRGTGLSATGILQSLQAQGAKIFKIDASNIATALPGIQASQAVKSDIANAVGAGQYAVIAEREFVQGRWSGAGYYLIDPNTGGGAYLLEGGYAGGGEGTDCQMQPATQPGSQPTNNFFTGLFLAIALVLLAALAVKACLVTLPVCAGAGVLAFSASASAQMPPGPPLAPLGNMQTVWDAFMRGRAWPTNAPGFSKTPQKPFGDCTEQQLGDLRQAQKDACAKPSSCSGNDCDQAAIEEKVANGEDCIAKRLAVMDTCFGGGDLEHWNQIRERMSGLNKCYGCYAKALQNGGNACKP